MVVVLPIFFIALFLGLNKNYQRKVRSFFGEKWYPRIQIAYYILFILVLFHSASVLF
jgi:hypothetical protein